MRRLQKRDTASRSRVIPDCRSVRLFGRRRASQSRTEQYVGVSDLTRLLVAIAASDHRAAAGLLDATPSLATARVARRDEFLLADRLAQVYEGDTALHAAAFSYDAEMARELVRRGAGVRARIEGAPNRFTRR
jgi:hypothetical protein